MIQAPSHSRSRHRSSSKSGSAGLSSYETVTSHILESLERGVVPWRKPWRGGELLPCNAVTKRPYRGVNLFLLSLAPYRDHRWLTFRQAQSLGGHVTQGEQSAIAVFWKKWEVTQKDRHTGEDKVDSIPLLRLYRVFNVEQCQGLSLPMLPELSGQSNSMRISLADEVVRSMPDPPTIRESGNSAWYRPSLDLVQVPPIGLFATPDAFYNTLFHELAHATGHERRLGRPTVMDTIQFGSGDYSREELIAELASAFCCAAIGLDNSLVENSAGYIQSWLGVLKHDPKAVVQAAAQAQRAADCIRGLIEGPDEVLYRHTA